MIAHHWENWITSSELSQELNLTKRRANQILKYYLELGIIEMNILVKYPDDGVVSKLLGRSTYAAPVYKCKFSEGKLIDES